MPECGQMPTDMMAATASFHADQTRWHIHQELHQLRSREALLHGHISVLVHSYQVENGLAEIDANHAYAHGFGNPFCSTDNSGGPSITDGARRATRRCGIPYGAVCRKS